MVAAVGVRIGFLGGAAGWFKEGAPGSRRAHPIRKAGEHLGRGSRRSVESAGPEVSGRGMCCVGC